MKLIIFCLLLTGCGNGRAYKSVCVDGVSYVQFTTGVSVQMDQHGNVVECE